MGGLHIPILMGLTDIDPMAFDPVVVEQLAVSCGELFVGGQVVHGGRQAVAPDPTRHPAGTMQSVLQPRGQRLKRLRMAEVNVLPVRVRKDGVKHHVVEGDACDRYVQ